LLRFATEFYPPKIRSACACRGNHEVLAVRFLERSPPVWLILPALPAWTARTRL